VTDASIDALLQMRALERLGLSQTVVSDGGVARLGELPNLAALDVGR
jgi:hypothetical protein